MSHRRTSTRRTDYQLSRPAPRPVTSLALTAAVPLAVVALLLVPPLAPVLAALPLVVARYRG